ncbi:conjugal transfer protein [Clostridiaceae bacterium AF29-16BH]|nr:conjugal transfer protein [Clostridiaceae bacterium AF29-16BH]
MPCPHNEITIVQRSQRQSAVAAAAYQSGEKLFCEYDQQVKHYPEKRGIVHNEILLPANAPPEYADRNTLWNAAEAVEKQWNSQLARRWVLSIPREIPPDQYAALVRDFCNQQFVSKGMCVDFAIHDKGDGNPHAHVMLTMRAMDEHGKWLPKSRKVYDLDENGERIKLPSGRWKSHKEDTVDWNDRKYCEIWRHEWEIIQNRYLEANNRPERVDLRSYERQGLDIIPTVHEGAAVRQMEKRGIQTNIGNLNREIKAANSLMKSIRQLIKNLKGWIIELSEKRKELLAEKAAEEAVFLPNLLMKYMEVRKAERSDWTRAGQNRGTSKDLKAVSEALSYLQRKGLSTVEDLENFIETSGKSAADYRKQMKPKEARSKVIDGILASRTDCKECKPVYEKYQKIFFKKTKETFKQEHPEVARFEKASAYLAKHPDDKDSTKKELLQEQAKLVGEIADLKVPLTEVQEDLKKLRDIRYWVRKATPGTEESKEPPKKQPLKEVLQDKADEKKAQKNAPAQTKHKQQDMEL